MFDLHGQCGYCDGSGWSVTGGGGCVKCRGTGKAASMLDVTNVGEFRCHMCASRNRKDLQPCTIKIGVIIQLSCYLCKECQLKLAAVVKNYVSVAPPPPDTGVDRSIIV